MNTREYNQLQTEGTGEGYTIEPKGKSWQKMADEFAAEWTKEVTTARREMFNQWVRSTPDANRKLVAKQKELGWTMVSLKRAVEMHNL